MIVHFKLWHLHLGDKEVPKDVTHVVVDDSITTIKKFACAECYCLVSVIMGKNVKKIEKGAFYLTPALQFVRLSNTLEYIGDGAFFHCHSLEALFLPSTVTLIENAAFRGCWSLRLLILPNSIDLSNVGHWIIGGTSILQIANTVGVDYTLHDYGYYEGITDGSVNQVNEWLIHHMDESPFHKLCYDPSVTTKQIKDCLLENKDDAEIQIDPTYDMTPLHMLSMNPHASDDTIAALLNSNMEAVFHLDSQEKTPLDYARDYNVRGLIAMITGLCNHKISSIPVEVDTALYTTAM